MVEIGERVAKKPGYESAPTLVRVAPGPRRSGGGSSRGTAPVADWKKIETGEKIGFVKIGEPESAVEIKLSDYKKYGGGKKVSRTSVKEALAKKQQADIKRQEQLKIPEIIPLTPQERAIIDQKLKQEKLQQQFGTRIDRQIRAPEIVPEPPVTLLGDQEIVRTIRPAFGTKRDDQPGVEPGFEEVVELRDIQPDYTVGAERVVEELIPGAGVPLTAMQEQIYLTSSKDVDKFNELIESKKPGAARELRFFLRDKQAELKKDIGRYNTLLIKYNSNTISNEEFKELNDLVRKIQAGDKGTLRDMLQESTAGVADTRRRALLFSIGAYEAEKEVLKYQIGGSIAGGVLGASKAGRSVLGIAQKFEKPLRAGIVPAGLGYGGFAGYGEFQGYGDLGDALATGLGTSAGFFGAAYSKQVVEGVGKGAKTIGKFVDRRIIGDPSVAPERIGVGIGGKAGQRAKPKTKQVQVKKDKKKVSKEDVKEFLSYDQRNIRYIEPKEMSFADKSRKARELYDLIKGKLTPQNYKEGIKQYVQILRETYGDDFVRDFLIQEGAVSVAPQRTTFSLGGEQAVTPVAVKSKVPKGIIDFVLADKIMGDFTEEEQASQLVAGLKYKTRQDNMQISEVNSIAAVTTAQGLESETKIDTAQASSLVSPTITQPRIETQPPALVSYPGEILPRRPRTPKPPRLPRVPEVPTIGLSFKRPIRPVAPKVPAWRGEVKEKGKWKKVTPKPATIRGALAEGAKYADNTPSKQFRAVPLTKTIKKDGKKKKVIKKIEENKLFKGNGYFEENRDKFREYKVRKGQKITTPRRFIEKNKAAIDTFGEKKGLSIAKFKKQINRRRTPFGF